VGQHAVVLDANAIDRQGGIVSVRLRRDDTPWGQPLAYYDSYRWQITGTEGLHTFAIEYRDRANNTTVVTTTVTLGRLPTGTVVVEQPNGAESYYRYQALDLFERNLGDGQAPDTGQVSRLRLQPDGEEPAEYQISVSPDFANAEWHPFVPVVEWPWPIGKPQIAYLRFRSREGIAGPAVLFGDELPRQYLPLVSSGE
jgi:hypothetical protein